MTRHTLSVLVENKPGVLARIAGLFSRRGFNIDSLAVGPTEHSDISRMTVVVDVEEFPLEQVTKQLNKLVEVLKVVELDHLRPAAGQLVPVGALSDSRADHGCSHDGPEAGRLVQRRVQRHPGDRPVARTRPLAEQRGLPGARTGGEHREGTLGRRVEAGREPGPPGVARRQRWHDGA